MKYFIDTEFLEGSQKEKFPISLFRKQTPNTIDLISIGIVAEYGREYYAISKDFNLEEAWNRFQMDEEYDGSGKLLQDKKKVYWLRDNVLKPIWRDLFKTYQLTNDVYSNKASNFFIQDVDSGYFDKHFSFKSLKSLLKLYGKTNKQIAKDIKDFTNIAYFTIETGKTREVPILGKVPVYEWLKDKPEFYAYYADYDWVVFCWLFGKMMDLPKGFPMYCKDLKQILDTKIQNALFSTRLKCDISTNDTLEIKLKKLKNHPDYPKQQNNHNAIEDARWNKKLFDFLNMLS